MGYDIKAFRTVKHGKTDENAYCRHCDFSLHQSDVCDFSLHQSGVKDVSAAARRHARKTKHTVDVYREKHVEYTCHVKDVK